MFLEMYEACHAKPDLCNDNSFDLVAMTFFQTAGLLWVPLLTQCSSTDYLYLEGTSI